MVEEINLTINRSMDSYTYKLPFCNVNITLEGDKTDPQPEIEGNLPVTKQLIGNEISDMGEWVNATGTLSQLFITIASDGILKHGPDGNYYHLYANGIGNQNLFFIWTMQWYRLEFNEYYYNLFFNEPASTVELISIKDWDSFKLVYMNDLTWSTEKTHEWCLGYNKSTDTLYSSEIVLHQECEYYSSKCRAYIGYLNNTGQIINCGYLSVKNASSLIPSLKNVE